MSAKCVAHDDLADRGMCFNKGWEEPTASRNRFNGDEPGKPVCCCEPDGIELVVTDGSMLREQGSLEAQQLVPMILRGQRQNQGMDIGADHVCELFHPYL